MPFDRPTLDELRVRIKADLKARLPGTDPLLRWNNLGIIGDVEAGATHLLYGRLEWSFQQMFPDTAEGEFLERWASIWGVTRKVATPASGRAQFPAAAGTSIPSGALLARRDGVQFATTAGMGVDPATLLITVPIAASVPGAASNTAAGVQMTMLTTQVGVTPLGVVIDPGLAGGAEEETDDELLRRLLLRIQFPPGGGNQADYVRWTLEVPGVTRAWCYPTEQGPGTVVVRFMMDTVHADTQGIPAAGDVALVAAHLAPLAPVTAIVLVFAPTPFPINVSLAGLVNDTADTRTAITAALTDLMFLDAAPAGLPAQSIQGIVPDGQIYPSQIIGSINTAPGVQRFRLVAPLTTQTPPLGGIGVLGTVSFAAGP